MGAIRATVSALVVLFAAGGAVPAARAADDGGPSAARPGAFLIAVPGMGDPRFDRTVILIVQHDRGGAFGIIVNRPVEDEPLTKLLEELGQKSDGASGKIAIYAGGPVASDIGFVLHSAEYQQPETLAIDKDLAMTSSPAVLRDIATQHGPQKYIFAFGYAGWGPGQLEDELAHRVWFTAPGDAKLLFDDDPTKLWQDALGRRERAL
jgi:putative transcriptional regulator